MNVRRIFYNFSGYYPIWIMRALSSNVIIACYTIDSTENLHLHYRETALIASISRRAFKTIENGYADGTAAGVYWYVDCKARPFLSAISFYAK